MKNSNAIFFNYFTKNYLNKSSLAQCLSTTAPKYIASFLIYPFLHKSKTGLLLSNNKLVFDVMTLANGQ